MKMEQTECYETLAYKIQMLRDYPEESIQQLTSSEPFLNLIALVVHFDIVMFVEYVLPLSGRVLERQLDITKSNDSNVEVPSLVEETPLFCSFLFNIKCKGKGHPYTSTEALYRPYGPQGE
jgi:hypothetical protein